MSHAATPDDRPEDKHAQNAPRTQATRAPPKCNASGSEGPHRRPSCSTQVHRPPRCMSAGPAGGRSALVPKVRQKPKLGDHSEGAHKRPKTSKAAQMRRQAAPRVAHNGATHQRTTRSRGADAMWMLGRTALSNLNQDGTTCRHKQTKTYNQTSTRRKQCRGVSNDRGSRSRTSPQQWASQMFGPPGNVHAINLVRLGPSMCKHTPDIQLAMQS